MRILIVDDNASFLDAARTLLEAEGLEVVALASTGDEARELCALHLPDVALVDVTLSGESGFDVARRLACATPAADTILISTHDERDYLELIADSPARGFLPKSDLSAGSILAVLDRGEPNPRAAAASDASASSGR